MHTMNMHDPSSSKPEKVSAPEPSESLENTLPEGLVVDRAWLNARGFSRPRVDYYLRAGRLQAVARGAYRRPGPPLKWEHLVYSLQVQGYPVHVGGRAALELQGYTHYLSLGGTQRVDLYGVRHLSPWLLAMDAPVQFELHGAQLFGELPLEAITTKAFGHWDWPLRYATPELALLELLAEVNEEADFSVADKFFESAATLRPALIGALLRACTQVKAKRLFLWFAARHAHPWLKKLDTSGVDLGSGKRVIVPGGALDKQYQITVPREMMQEMANGSQPNFF
ncbi:hypothetical protein GALL_254550 [mine drainage metagenome]|uniref:Transcriptional regulator AbiEi antitoxin N-terminal domain-containing protein n=1 Tax=mine drainage metagenome TaxID=410659 RepID=A0A1J5R9B2_9ZZZZ